MKFKEILSKIARFTNSPLGDILTAVIPGLRIVDKIVDTANNVFGDVTIFLILSSLINLESEDSLQ